MFPVIKGASYVLVHTPHLLAMNGTTQTMERMRNPDSEYLTNLSTHLREYRDVLSYPPNQVFIGAYEPGILDTIQRPWYLHGIEGSRRYAPYGEIMPEDEFFGVMKMVDSFDLVLLETEFARQVSHKLKGHPSVSEKMLEKISNGSDMGIIDKAVNDDGAEPLMVKQKTVGCVRRAHAVDENLSSGIMTENIASKASAHIAVCHLLKNLDLNPDGIDYIIEASEEACGDMNQRGGGNFAKAIAETAGCSNATGADTRAFCAGPVHALVQAAALVQSGIFENVIVTGGGALAKLGMNGKEHAAKGLPVLEDVIGAFAVLVSKNDSIHPVIRTDMIGRHRIRSGSSPQMVIQSMVTDPLDSVGLQIKDIDKFSVEMQNPEITEPAGAGDVPKANYKMIGALAVKRGEIGRDELNDFVTKHGMPGFAPTQGHIPSGVPFIGPAVDMIMSGQINRAMIIGKGSLFLARMTNQFDGMSFVMDRNEQVQPDLPVPSDDTMTRKILAQVLRDAASKLLLDE